MATKSSTSASTGGIGFFGLLGLLFITLKLLNITIVASWPWWVVLLPIYGPLVVVLVIVAIGFLLIGIGHLLKK